MRPFRWALVCYAPAAILLAVVAAAAFNAGLPPSRFTRDPAVLLDAHPLIGLVSHAGVLVWTATAAITLFTATLLRSRGADRQHWTFLAGAGLLTTLLLLDDLFLFHEWLFPVVLGIRTRFVFAAYIVLTLLLFGRFATLVRRSEYPLLAVALGWFAISVGIDVLPERWFRQDYLYLIEDSAKLFGIVGWFGYFARVSAGFLSGTGAGDAPPPIKEVA